MSLRDPASTRRTCPSCDGHGGTGDHECERCRGRGHVDEEEICDRCNEGVPEHKTEDGHICDECMQAIAEEEEDALRCFECGEVDHLVDCSARAAAQKPLTVCNN